MGSAKALHRKRYGAFLARLVLAREQAKLTQRAAAERLGRTQSFVAQSESGERRVDFTEAEEFAVAYRVPITFFVTPSGRRPSE